MKRIWKYETPVTESFGLELSLGAKLLHFGVDHWGELMLWILVDDEQATVLRHFRLFGTGHEVPEAEIPSLGFVGTTVTPEGLVWHLFEVHS